MNRHEQVGGEIEVERLLDEHRRRHLELSRALAGDALDLYVRESTTMRVVSDASGTLTVRTGSDQGSALRLFGRDWAERLFRCSTSSDPRDLSRAGEPPGRSTASTLPGDGETDRVEPLIDVDADLTPPDSEALGSWLTRARAHVDEVERRRGGGLAEAWVEAGVTREVWTGPRGEQTLRVRVRGWAMGQPAEGRRPTRSGRRPWLTAARNWRGLDDRDWADRIAAVGPALADPLPSPVQVPAVFHPDAAALIVHSISRSWEPGRFPVGLSVGPAWQLTEDPLEPGALYGSLFDDEGQIGGRVELARGGRVVGHLPAHGHRRRGSFRDRPATGPSHTVLAPPPATLPSEFLDLDEVGVQPLTSDRWLVRASGWYRRGERSRRVDDLTLTIAPLELVRRCVGGVGESKATHKGGRCPALRFEGLVFES